MNNAPSPNLGLELLAGGSARLNFDGIPGRIYAVQYAESLSTPAWQTLATLAADEFGMFAYVDTPPPNSPQRYYRAIEP
jgi:hypothetical protein